MLRNVNLYGDLREKYGDSFEFDVESPGQACAALNANFPGFYNEIRQRKFHIVIGQTPDNGVYLGQDEVTMNVGSGDINIVPYIEGSGGGGSGSSIAKIVIGVALIAAGGIGAFGLIGAAAAGGFGATAFTVATATITWGNIAFVGFAVALSGAAALMAPSPQVDNYQNREDPAQRASFLFNGVQNTIEQGGPVPVVYGGPLRVGSTTVSAGFNIEQIPVDD